MNDWRIYRPAIWLAFLGLALGLLITPPYLGVLLLGGAIGVAARIRRRGPRRPAAGRAKTNDGARRKDGGRTDDGAQTGARPRTTDRRR